jgi:hypothetical protein
LHEEWLVQTKLPNQRNALFLSVILTEQDVERVTNEVEQREGDEADNKEDRDCLEKPGANESNHADAN